MRSSSDTLDAPDCERSDDGADPGDGVQDTVAALSDRQDDRLKSVAVAITNNAMPYTTDAAMTTTDWTTVPRKICWGTSALTLPISVCRPGPADDRSARTQRAG
jgi:hypothetical protein